MNEHGMIQLEMLLQENEFKLNTDKFQKRVMKWLERNEEANQEKVSKKLIQSALESVDMADPNWTFVAAKELLNVLYRDAQKNRGYEGASYGSFYELIKMMSVPQFEQRYPVYKSELLESYTEKEINELGEAIDPSKDKLFNYVGLFLLNDRYLARPEKDKVFELPQERFMIIAMEIMRLAPKEKRLEHIKEAYWALSNLYMTVATPTLANAGKTHGQLSSCFIDTVEDSLDGIYLNLYDSARVSKYGGGVGIYYGKVRSLGSDIRGQVGNSSGTTPWVKLLNQTAVSVDQLGQRQGAIAVYLDVFHKDIIHGFLELKTNNGDDRNKAHDIFTGVSVPDLFMEKLKEVDEDGRSIGEWYVFDPHTVKTILGFSLEDFYDDKKGPEGNGLFRQHYYKAVEAAKAGVLPIHAWSKVRAMDIMSRIMVSQLETGTPYMFYRDAVNRANPNKHVRGAGITSIYCSNLCSEIAQNQSPTIITEEYVVEEDGEEYTITKRKHGDYVVCNLSSINLSKAVPDNVLERLIPIQMRMLDNVIDVNTLPLKQAETTNKRFRPVGLGTFGWHHLLALEGIYWESQEATEYADKLYEKIAFLTIQASMELAKELGAYKKFEGSEWSTGEYFERRDYNSPEWLELKEQVKDNGVRNGWMMAIAPNSSTAKIGNSTDGIDPLYDLEFIEEKKNFKFKVTAPDLNGDTYLYYQKNRFLLDQKESIRQNAARQRHIDQSISFNFYVMNEINAKDLLDLHLTAWDSGLKTTYYVRSTAAANIESCEWCHS